jgi:hypothetical protein
MAEYLPLHDEGPITRAASAAITGGQLLAVSGSGTVAPTSAATAAWVGVAGFDAVAGDNVTVWAGDGAARIVAGTGGVTAGVLVEAAAGGTVVTHTNGTLDVNIVGLALNTAVAGALVEVQLDR